VLLRVSQQRGHRWVQAESFRALECKCVTDIDVSEKLLVGFLVARCVREVEAH
jgi:hypothetical protein